jgi:hypothetical protein
VAETAMYRVKQLFGGHLTLRDYDAQVGEAMAMIRALCSGQVKLATVL